MPQTGSRAFELAEQGLLPDMVIRLGIRRLLKARLIEIGEQDFESMIFDQQRFIEMMNASEIAPVPHLANEQHYEVAAEFFKLVLGGRLKYSCGYCP